MDGSTPTAESTLYEEPITLSETTTVKAIAMISSTSVATRHSSNTGSALRSLLHRFKDGISSSVTSRTLSDARNCSRSAKLMRAWLCSRSIAAFTKGVNAGGEDEPGGDDH